METMNISLPPPLKGFVDQEVSDGSYSSVSEYIRSLIREAQKQKAQKHLEGLLLEGLESGPANKLSKESFEKLRSKALNKFKNKSFR